MGRPNVRPAVGFAIEYLDVALLAAAILLAAYFALKTRSRSAIVGVMIFSLLHFGFWRQGCICPIGAIQTAARAVFDRSYPISPIVALFFLIPLVSTFLLGRSFCAAVCPLGAIQDVVVLHPVKVPLWLQHALRMLAWVYLGAAVVTIPVAVVAYFQWGWGSDFIVLMVVYLIVQALDGNLLVPLLFSEVVNLHPVAIIVSVLFFGGLWGFWGVFFAIPLATLVKALITAWPRSSEE